MSDGVLSPRFRAATSGVLVLELLIAFEALAVTTAMPLAARDLHGQDLYALAFSAFSAAGVVGNVAAGAWGDRSAPGSPLLVAVGVFAAGLLVSGAAPAMALLIVGRALQGFGAGAIGVTLYVLVARVYPEALHPRVFALLAAAWVLPSFVGPFAAGAVATALTWRWVFLGIVPLVAVATALLLPMLRVPAPPTTDAPIPAARIAWSVLAAACLLVMRPALDVPAVGPVLAVLAGGAAVAALRPLVPRGAFVAARGLPALIAAQGLFSASFAAADAYLPYSLIALRGLPPVLAGGIATVGAVAWATGSGLQSRLSGRWSDRRCIRTGAASMLAGLAIVGLGTASGLIPLVVLGWLAAGLGIGIADPRLSTSTLAASAPEERGRSSAALHVADGFGIGVGLTLIGLATAVAPGAQFTAAFGLAMLLALLAVLVAPRAAARSFAG